MKSSIYKLSQILFAVIVVLTLPFSGCQKDKLIDEEKTLYNQYVTLELENALFELGIKINLKIK